jgi:hypothetical protein
MGMSSIRIAHFLTYFIVICDKDDIVRLAPTLGSVRQLLWASLPYIYIMVIYWVIIRNVTVEKSLLLEARKLYVGL